MWYKNKMNNVNEISHFELHENALNESFMRQTSKMLFLHLVLSHADTYALLFTMSYSFTPSSSGCTTSIYDALVLKRHEN